MVICTVHAKKKFRNVIAKAGLVCERIVHARLLGHSEAAERQGHSAEVIEAVQGFESRPWASVSWRTAS